MAARKIIDWNKVKAVLAKEDFAIVSEQRGRSLELQRILSTPVPKIDMAYYKSVMENQALVSEIESELKSFVPAKGDPAPLIKALKEQRIAAVQSAKETVDQVNSAVSGYKADLEGIQTLPHYENMSAEHVYEASPGLEKVYYDRLKEGKVYHDEHQFGEKFIG